MRDKEKERRNFTNHSRIYGPVPSWRFGRSLGVDPIFQNSTCSFNCIYCQLGNIQNVTDQIRVYTPTDKVLEDLRNFLKQNVPFDVITHSGSGEPTLAANLAEIVRGVRELCPDNPQFLLTNATELVRDEVLANVSSLDKIIVKIDAADEETFRQINRPAPGITLKRVLQGVEKLKASYGGKIEVQSMFMPLNRDQTENFARILETIAPHAVQLNTPKRPWPLEWHRENRGNHLGIHDYKTRALKTLEPGQMQQLHKKLEGRLPGLEILSRNPARKG